MSVLTAMRFHCVTAPASAPAGGAADAPRTPSAPISAQSATVASQTDRLRAIPRALLLTPKVCYVCTKAPLDANYKMSKELPRPRCLEPRLGHVRQ